MPQPAGRVAARARRGGASPSSDRTGYRGTGREQDEFPAAFRWVLIYAERRSAGSDLRLHGRFGIGCAWSGGLGVAERVANGFRCRRCGSRVDPGDRFCPGCGVNLIGQVHRTMAAERHCPACGHACSGQATFCNGCGRRLFRGRRSPWRWLLAIGAVVVAFFVVAGSLSNRATKNVAADQARAEQVAETPIATPLPMSDDWKASYPQLGDVREIAVRPWHRMGERLAFRGTIVWIRVARPDETIPLGDEGDRAYAAELGVAVATPEHGYEVLVVGYDEDTVGIFDGTMVRVYGELVDTESYDDDYGDEFPVPLIEADLVEVDPFDGLPPSITG
jgi:predicted nucleic acid-binding Zn ribbon protein